MEKRMSTRLLAIRLMENRCLAEKNQEQLMQILSRLESRVNLLCELTEQRDHKDNMIRLNESAKIYLDESLTLHGENGKTKGSPQHPVYTLHDRYVKHLGHQKNLNSVLDKIQAHTAKLTRKQQESAYSIEFIKSFEQTQLNRFQMSSDLMHSVIESILSFDSDKSRLRLEDCSLLELIGNELNLKDMTTVEINSIVQTSKELRPAYMSTVSFFQSISQTSQITQCELLHVELAEAALETHCLFVNAHELILKSSALYNWLPFDYHTVKSKAAKLFDWFGTLANLFEDLKRSKNCSTLKGAIKQIYTEYTSSFNPKFSLGTFNKSDDKWEEAEKERLLTEVARTHGKLESLAFESNRINEKLSMLLARKSALEISYSELLSVEPALNELSSLVEKLESRHDMIEMSLFGFFDSELGSLDVENEQFALVEESIVQQMSEAFACVVLPFLNDNLQKWIMMENASMEAKEQLCTLTSIDGDWFLDEMLSLVANCNHLTHLIGKVQAKLAVNEINEAASSFETIDSLTCLFFSLKELLFESETRLYPELVRLTLVNKNEIDSVLNQLKDINIDDFFLLISRDYFIAENFASVS